MYTFGSRIRYSETDEYGKLTLTGIMNYLQDCSTFQSEDIGLGISYLTEHHQAWWLSSWQIVIDRYLRWEKKWSSEHGPMISRAFTDTVILLSVIRPGITW